MHDYIIVRTFNSEMLQLAREAAGFTQSSLAQAVNFSQSKVSKLEDGLMLPSVSDTKALARELKIEPEFFSRNEPARSPTVSFFRKTNSLPLKAVSVVEAQINIRRLKIQDILRVKQPDVRISRIQPRKPEDAVEIARRMRKEWDVPPGPVKKLMRLVERLGCIVEHFDFECGKLDGISIWTTSGTPLIFLNPRAPADRMRLTLSHELGHIVMHREPSPTVEDEAWDFAAEFLMPSREIAKSLHPLDLPKLGDLKVRWGVSMQALLKRSQKLEQISERQARYLWMQIGKAGYRVHEPFGQHIEREEPTGLRMLQTAKN